MSAILKDTTSTTIYEDRYQLYIDTTMKIEPKVYGTFMEEYDPIELDIFLKKIPALKDTKLKRDPADGSKRFLHSINKMKKDSITSLKKLFNFKIDLDDKDSRSYLLDTPKIKIIEYSDKSLALFSTDISTLIKLRDLDGKGLKYNAGLTGPGGVRSPGYLLAKSSAKYAKILESFSEESSDDPPEKTSLDTPPKKTTNSIENIAPGPKDEPRFRICGDQKYLHDRLEEIREDFGENIKTLQKKSLPDDRFEIEIEIIRDD